MNFWAHQHAAKNRSRALFICFFLVLSLCLLVPYFFIYTGISFIGSFRSPEPVILKTTLLHGLQFWRQPVFYITALVIGLPIVGGAVLQLSRLASDSGKYVARMLHGQEVPHHSEDFYQRRLLNIVEEMSIASGVPIPRVFLLNDEPGINALVAGNTSHNAVLCVTRGASELLQRDELQGVIAHEYSHLLNGDMAFHSLMFGLLKGFFLSTRTGKRLDIAEAGSGDVIQDLLFLGVQIAAVILLLPLWLWLYGMIFGTIGRMMKAAFSRSREYLADAYAVQFTRFPQGLANAMKTIGALPKGQVIRRVDSMAFSHFFFTDGTPQPLMFSLAPSHPPLKKRIKRLDPDFDGNFPVIDRNKLKEKILTLKEQIHQTGKLAAGGIIPDCHIPRQLRFDALCDRIGTFNNHDIEQTGQIITQLPRELYEMTRTPEQAKALIYAIFPIARPGICEKRNCMCCVNNAHGIL